MDSDQTSHIRASGRGLHYLLTEILDTNEKVHKTPLRLKIDLSNG